MPDVSLTGYATSRLHPLASMLYFSLRPATHMHHFSRMSTPSGVCHRNSIVWLILYSVNKADKN